MKELREYLTKKGFNNEDNSFNFKNKYGKIIIKKINKYLKKHYVFSKATTLIKSVKGRKVTGCILIIAVDKKGNVITDIIPYHDKLKGI